MISLKDEIKKFQKLVYNKQLAEFVTVDQMFVGGGITIESMIHESNFIVEELKKMNAVFLNFCKLNEKVYTKIMEHQLNIHNEQSKINSITGSLDRKIDETLKTMKKLHEDTVGENRKSIDLIETQTSPIWKELEKKVDKSSFEAQMKRFLEEYDESEPEKEKEGGSEGNVVMTKQVKEGVVVNGVAGNLTLETEPAVKKKGKVGFEEFYKLQSQLEGRMKSSQQRLQSAVTTASEGKELLLKYIPIISKNANQVSIHTTQIHKINHEMLQQERFINSSVDKLHQELNHRTNDQIWNAKFELFYEKQVKPTISAIQENLKTRQRQEKQIREQMHKKIHAIDEENAKIKVGAQNLQANAKKQSKDLMKLTDDVQQNYQQFLKEKIAINVNIQNFKTYSSLKFKDLEQLIQNDIDNVKKIIESLAQKIEDTVLKTVLKKVEAQIKAIQQDLRAGQVKAKGLRNDIVSICEEIQNMKQVLSKKANFTDIIHQVQKKADREDFRQLQSRFHETSQQFVSKNLNESIVLAKIDEKARTASLNRASKTLLAPRLSPNRLNKTDFDISTKLFMCGLDNGHIGENRGMMSQNSRRKSLKSSAAVISDFVG